GLSETIQAASVSAMLLCVGLCFIAWMKSRDDAGMLLAVTLAAVLIAVRGVATALLLTLDLSTFADVADTGLGLLVLGCLTWAATSAVAGPRIEGVAAARDELFSRVAEVTALLVFGASLTGVTVRAVGASWACSGTF